MAENSEATVSSEAAGKKSFSEIFHSVTSSAPAMMLKDVVSKVWDTVKGLGGKAKVKIHEWTAPKDGQPGMTDTDKTPLPAESSAPSGGTAPRELPPDWDKYAAESPLDGLER